MDRTQSTSRSGAPSVEATLLARLGLPAGASSQDVEAAHDRLVEFLEGTPSDLRGWARQQIGLIDEAYALLSDPTIDRSALADSAIATAAATPALAIAAAPVAQGAPVTSAVAPRNDRPLKRLAIAAAAIVGVAAILVAGFNLNGGTGIPPLNGSPDTAAAGSPAPSLDPAKVAALMQKIQADPKDITSLQSLADLYYDVGDFKTSGSFLEKIIVIDPKNVTALMALGAAQFNLGNSADAEKQWRAVLAIDPNAVEAHYDLGFMYLSKNPPDVANVKLEWGKVIAIDPNSAIAKTVQQHLASLEGSPAPSGASPAPSASGAPASAAPSPSPAASPSPSGN